MKTKRQKDNQAAQLEMDLAKTQYGNELFAHANMLLATQEYGRARKVYRQAAGAYPSFCEESISRCKRLALYCKKKVLGIDDCRSIGGAIWIGDQRISVSEMRTILRHKGALPLTFRKGGRRRGLRQKGLTIGQAMDSLLKSKGIGGVTLEEAVAVAREIKPNTKFGASHLAYYVSVFKKQNPDAKGVGKNTPKKLVAKKAPKK